MGKISLTADFHKGNLSYDFCVNYSRLKKKNLTKDLDEKLDISDKEDQANEEELETKCAA